MAINQHFSFRPPRPFLQLPAGTLLDVGPGHVWPGLNLIKNQPNLDLVGIGYSAPERQAALEQAQQWGCRSRVEYLDFPLSRMPLPDRSVDRVVSFGAMHRWEQPATVFNEIARVLKLEGDFYLGDVRKDAPRWSRWLGFLQPVLKRQVWRARAQSLNLDEFKILLENTRLTQSWVVAKGPEAWILAR